MVIRSSIGSIRLSHESIKIELTLKGCHFALFKVPGMVERQNNGGRHLKLVFTNLCKHHLEV